MVCLNRDRRTIATAANIRGRGQGSAPTAVALRPVAVVLRPYSASCKSRDGRGDQGVDRIKTCMGLRTFLAARPHPGAEAALPRPIISASAAVILRPPAAVLLRPPRRRAPASGEKVGGLDQRLKKHKAARTRTYLGAPRDRTAVHPYSASPSHLLCFVDLF